MKRLLIAVISLLCLAASAGAAEFESEASLSGVHYRIGLGMPFFDVVCSTTGTTCVNLNSPTITGTTTFTGPALLSDGSTSAPGLAFASEPLLGMFRRTNAVIAFTAAGSERFEIAGNTVALGIASNLGWSSAAAYSSGVDVTLARDAADTLAQRRSTNAQTFRVYSTYTDVNNYQRVEIDATADPNFYLSALGAGTGANRSLWLRSGTANNGWGILGNTSTFAPAGNNNQDLGSSVRQVKNFYLGTSISSSTLKALTESSSTPIVQIAMAASVRDGGKFLYCIDATDATDFQDRCGEIRWAANNKAGTETCSMSNWAGVADASITETEDGDAAAITTGTLTYAITFTNTPTNACQFEINAVSSLAQSVFQVLWRIDHIGTGAVTAQ